MSAQSRITWLAWLVQHVAALLLATLASGCVPGMYSYLDESPTASVAQLQAAWDARFPAGTARADLLAQLPPYGDDTAGAWNGDYGFFVDVSQGKLVIASGANQIACNAVVYVDVTFDSEDRIVKSVVGKGGICL